MIRRVTFGSVLMIALLLASGAAYESVAGRRVKQQHPAPGQILDMSGRQLHVHCLGAGPLTILVEAGSGSWSLDWRPAQVLLSERYRTCTYDRPGYGWSDPAHESPSFERIGSDLDRVVASIDDGTPLVLMGHSLGSLYARAYARTHPGRVAGLVLVDGRHEDARVDLPAGIIEREAAARRTNTAARFLARLGIVRLVGPALLPAPDLAASQVDTFWGQAARPHFFATVQSEVDALGEFEASLHGVHHDVPVVVVRHGITTMFGDHPDAEAAERVWQLHQEDLSTRTDQGVLHVAERAGHNIHLEQPQALLDAMTHLETAMATSR